MGDADVGNTRYVRVNVRTVDGSQFNGKVNLSGNERVSDLFTRGDTPFVVLVDVIHDDRSGRTLFVNKDHIVWVEPED